MNQKIKLKLFSVSVFAAGCVTSATAQTNAITTPVGSVQSTEQLGKQQLYQKQQMAAYKPQPVPLERRTRITADPGRVALTGSKTEKQVTPLGKKEQPLTREQLMLQRKHASDKGMPTGEYDNAIKQLNQSLTK